MPSLICVSLNQRRRFGLAAFAVRASTSARSFCLALLEILEIPPYLFPGFPSVFEESSIQTLTRRHKRAVGGSSPKMRRPPPN